MATDTRRLHPTVLLLATAHFLVDGYGNIYAPLLPLLIPRLGLSLAAAGLLTSIYQLAASVSQIGFGRLADRWRPRVLVMAGPVLSIVLLSLVGIATSPLMLAVVLFAGGLGGAAFHPPAAALAHRLGGPRPGLAMSVHITGGTLGFSLAPLLFAPFAGRFGLAWTPLLMLPGLVVLAAFLARVPAFPAPAAHHASARSLRPYAKPLALLYAIVVLRTVTSLAFATFVPVMMTRRGASIGEAGAVVAAFLFAGGLGGLLGGPASDRFGPRRVIVLSLVLSTPFLVAAPFTSGWVFVTLLSIGGLFLQSTLPVNVIFAQAIAPVGAATVSSLMMGFAWGTGGLSVPLVGFVADRLGVAPTLVGLACLPIVAAVCAAPLPRSAPRRAPEETLDDLGREMAAPGTID